MANQEPKKDSVFKQVGDYLLSVLKTKIITDLINKFIQNSILRGIAGWVGNILLNILWDKWGLPFIQFLERKQLLSVDTKIGKIQVKMLNEAREQNDKDKYDRARDDIFK